MTITLFYSLCMGWTHNFFLHIYKLINMKTFPEIVFRMLFSILAACLWMSETSENRRPSIVIFVFVVIFFWQRKYRSVYIWKYVFYKKGTTIYNIILLSVIVGDNAVMLISVEVTSRNISLSFLIKPRLYTNRY